MFLKSRWTRFERRSLLLGLALFVASACGLFHGLTEDAVRAEPKASRKERKEEARQAEVTAAAADEKMEAAMDQASANLDKFEAALKKAAPNTKDFAIKYLVVEGDEGEYLWINEIQFANKKFTGKIANQPQFAKTVKYGQTITIEEEDVDDWMYVEDGKLKGGYTIRAQREMMQASERPKFDAQFKFKFE
jgi:uncharacterized protein YegJ (DUF2314 family)